MTLIRCTFVLCTIVTFSRSASVAVAQTMEPATVPATQPATQPASVPADAQALLNDVRDAYAKLASLEVAGTFALELDVAGQRQTKQSAFTGAFAAPNKFRHEMADDALVVGDGSKAYLYVAKVGKYAEADAPEARAPSAGLDAPLAEVLRGQNPSLYLAMCANAADELADGAQAVTKLDDARVGETDCHVLRIQTEAQDVRVMIDPATRLVRRMTFDLGKSIAARGVPDVKRATITIDYTTTKPNASMAEQRFAWSPPADATLARDVQVAAGEGEAEAMEGKAAPDFTLRDLQDNSVSLRSLRGSVVVLDFWATWCGPCRASLPKLDELNREIADEGVKIFAVNLREEKAAAQKFAETTGLKLPVLLDESGKVAQTYAVSGIPQTVVIDKRGVIRRVIVGFSPDTEAQLREAIRDANAVR
jgi:peroxiredoxin